MSPRTCLNSFFAVVGISLGVLFPWFPSGAIGIAGVAAAEKAITEILVVSNLGEFRFEVELVTTPEERSVGLMYRKAMAPDSGMLFDFGEEMPVAMWMKNTYLPLDMIFLRSDGSIAKIASHTVPLSLAIIASGEPVRGVLEVNAGTANRLGLKEGDFVRHAIFLPKR